jgi:hypothetical protein
MASPDEGSFAPGFLLTVGLVPLFLLIFLGSPVVACTTSGEANSAPLWTWLDSGGGMTDSVSGSSASSSDSSVSTGTETIGATKYSWVCDGSTVVHFTTHRWGTRKAVDRDGYLFSVSTRVSGLGQPPVQPMPAGPTDGAGWPMSTPPLRTITSRSPVPLCWRRSR